MTNPSALPSLLSVRGVSRRFADVQALDDVWLDIRAGEFFALLGPSGCGKTTLLRILAGFESPDTGSVTLDGADLLGIPPNKRPINLMFQSYALFPHLSVERNVGYGLARERRPRAEIADRVGAVLATVGLTTVARRRPHQLSGGQRQRVALARAIVKRPRLLLLDEPLSALDRKVRAEMQLELKRLQHEVGITFVVVTHDQEEAMSLADRIAVLEAGSVRQVDQPVALYTRPASRFVAGFVGSNNILAGAAAEGGVAVPGLGVLPAPNASFALGAPVAVTIRPENIQIDAVSSGSGGGDTAGGLTGTVLDTVFHGGSSRIAVRVDGLAEPLLATRPGAPTVEVDAPVRLSWNPEDAVLVPA